MNKGKILKLFLITGKTIDCSLGCVLDPQMGAIVKSNKGTILMFSSNSIIGVELEETREFRELFDGQKAVEDKTTA